MSMASARLLDGTLHLSPAGEVDLDNAYLIRDAVDRALAADKPAGIVVDLAGVTLFDSVGIGTLVSCFHLAAASGVRLRAANPAPIVYRQLWASGLVGLLGLPTPRVDGGRRAPTAAGV
ncbi:MAG TPA: STAS domain-containing protein [Micromonosporaceae bacterium]|nr:STAS domain-containing protein [Micromonosporaceae bacterium]